MKTSRSRCRNVNNKAEKSTKDENLLKFINMFFNKNFQRMFYFMNLFVNVQFPVCLFCVFQSHFVQWFIWKKNVWNFSPTYFYLSFDVMLLWQSFDLEKTGTFRSGKLETMFKLKSQIRGKKCNKLAMKVMLMILITTSFMFWSMKIPWNWIHKNQSFKAFPRTWQKCLSRINCIHALQNF